MCYLITNYYTLIYKIIPQEIKTVINYNGISLYNKEERDFEELKVANPIIITINNDQFLFQYISQVFCSKLYYQKAQLINNDFNILIPGYIEKIHTCI